MATGTLARKAVGTLARRAGRRALDSGAELLREAADRAADRASDVAHRALETTWNRRLPIQVSIDVAVPVSFAWEEWLSFEWLCEGVDTVQDVERDGDMLYGRIAGPRARDWDAEILDERPCESFAWRSVEGSDCAGLITFHELSERLTRIEIDLDVLPTGPGQALAFASHLAHRRAESELRRFKAHLEFINPDVYAEQNGAGAADQPETDNSEKGGRSGDNGND
jgi:uncharacterized membrane protein